MPQNSQNEIIVDTRQQAGKHRLKHSQLEAAGFCLVIKKLDYGDYARPASLVSIDTKRSLAELAQNLLQGHKRFKRECERAAAADGCLVILVENKFGLRRISDLANWYEPQWAMRARHGRVQLRGKSLAKTCETMAREHGVLFDFIDPLHAGSRIVELLERENELLERARAVRAQNE